MKRLYRSKKNRLIAGVFGGIAEYFNVSAAFLRIIFLLPTLVLGLPGVAIGLVLYLIVYVIIPEEP